MSHPFGDLIKRYLSRKHGLSQTKLAQGIYVDPAVITRMCQGRGLARERVLDVIVWLQQQAVFESVDEANALLKAAGLVELNPDQPLEMEIRCKLEETRRLAIREESSLDDHPVTIRRKRRIHWGIAATVVPVILLVPVLVWILTKPKSPIWQDDFSPLDRSKWAQVSAHWEDLPGETARLIESNPEEAFGKVESEIITTDIDEYPILRINVTAIDLNSSYTVQILDRRMAIAKDILQSIVIPGVQNVNLAEAMGWKGVQSFTINLWVGGDGQSVTFELVSLGAN